MQETQRAAEAQQILESDVWRDAWAHVQEQLLTQMRSAPANDTVLQCRLVDAVKVVDGVRRFLETTIATGKQAALRLEGKTLRRV